MTPSYRKNKAILVQLQQQTKGYNWCECCKRPIVVDIDQSDDHRLTIDHKFPRSLGGRSTVDNLQIACYDCNQQKRDNYVGVIPKNSDLRPGFRIDGRFVIDAHGRYRAKIRGTGTEGLFEFVPIKS